MKGVPLMGRDSHRNGRRNPDRLAWYGDGQRGSNDSRRNFLRGMVALCRIIMLP
jgi:hypothetical protein